MASNEVKLTIKVGDDGSLDVVAKKAKKAAKATEEVGNSTNKTRKARQDYSKGEKGVAGATNNSTKAFSKMRNSMTGGGGLVPAYATLAANVFALSAAFNVLRRAAQVEQLSQGLSEMGRASGIAMGTLAKGMQAATKNALSLEEAMRATSMITSAGLDPSMVEKFGAAAQKAAVALGRNTQDSLERFTRGVTKLEPELLDEIGLFVRVDEAADEYARKLGKTAGQLTSFERRQAFANATLEQANEKFGSVEVDANPYDTLAAAFSDLSKTGLNLLNNVLTPIVTLLANSTTALVGAMALFASTISGQLVGSLADYADKAKGVANANKGINQGTRYQLNLFNRSSTTLKNLSESLKDGTASTKEYDKAVDGQERSQRRNLTNLKKGVITQEEYTKRVKTAKSAINEIRGAEVRQRKSSAALAESKAINALQAGKYNVALKNLRRSMLLYRGAMVSATKSQGFFTKALRIGGVALKAFGTTARLAGAAVSILLGPISTAILVFSLLKEGFDALMNAFKSEATKALEEKLEGLSDTSKELKDNFAEVARGFAGTSDKIKGVTNSYIAYGNTLSTVIETTKDLGSTGAKGASKEQAKFLQQQINNSSRLKEALKEAFGTSVIVAMNGKLSDNVNKVLEVLGTQRALGSQMQSLKEAFSAAGEAAADYFNKLKPNTNVTQTTDGLKEALQATKGLRAGGDGPEAIREQFDKLPQSIREYIEAIEVPAIVNLNARIKADEKRLNEIGASISGLVASGADPKGSQITNLVNEGQKLQKNLAVFKNALTNLSAVDNLSTQLGIATELFTKEEQRLITAQALIDTKKQELDRVLAIGGNTEKQQKAIVKARNELNSAILANVDGQITFNNSLIESAREGTTLTNVEAEVNRLTKERDKLLQQVIDKLEEGVETAKGNLSVLQQQVGAERELLAISDRRNKLEADRIKMKQKALEIVRRAENRQSPLAGFSADLTAKDKAEIDKKLQEDKVKLIFAEEKAAKARIELEFTLLEAKFRLIDAELKLAAAQARQAGDNKAADNFTKIAGDINEARGGLEGLKNEVLAGIRNETVAKLYGVSESALNTTTAATNEALGRTQTGSTTDRIGGLSDLANAGEEVPGSKNIEALQGVFGPFMEQMSQLGPDGALVSAATQGAFSIASAWQSVSETFTALGDSAEAGMGKSAAVAGAVGASLAAVGQVLSANSQAQISAIDKQIAAEKKRDGKSAGSLATIQKLEKKKEAMQKKAFDQNKKVQMAVTVANTAASIMTALAAPPIGLGPVAGIPLAAAMAATGAIQLAVIAGTSYQGGGASGGAEPPRSVSVGERKSSVDMAKSQGGAGEIAYMRGGRGQGGPENFTPAFAGYKNRAEGGNTAFMVGEQGPELFVPERPGRIVPNDDIQQGTPVNATINISAVDAAGVEDVLMNQRGNIISMIRDAANAQGNTFLEEINVAEL